MYRTVKHHYDGSFTSYILIYGFVYRNGPTNVRKLGKGVSVSCRAPYLRPGRGRGMTPEGIITVRNSDLRLYCMTQTGPYIPEGIITV